MSIETFITEIENALTGLKSTPVIAPIITDVEAAAAAGWSWFKTNVPAIAVSLGETILTGAVTGTPWSALEGTLITQAEAAGITIEKNVATAALNAAQTNLIATGTSILSALPPVAPGAA